MTYIPISPKERDAMLETIGVKTLDDLFNDIPASRPFSVRIPAAGRDQPAAGTVSRVTRDTDPQRGFAEIRFSPS